MSTLAMGQRGRGQTALVTGASSGIGAAIARSLGMHGFDLVLVARRQDRLQLLADEISCAGSVKVDVIAADLGASTGTAAVVTALADRTRCAHPGVLAGDDGAGARTHRADRVCRRLHARSALVDVLRVEGIRGQPQ